MKGGLSRCTAFTYCDQRPREWVTPGACPLQYSARGRGCRAGASRDAGPGPLSGSPRPHVDTGIPARRADHVPTTDSAHSRRDPRHHLPFTDHSRIHRTPGTPVRGGERCRRHPGRLPRVPPRNQSLGLVARGARRSRRGPVEPGRGFGGRGGGPGWSAPKLAVMIASNSASTHTGSEQTSSANPLVAVVSASASRVAPGCGDSRLVMSSILDHFPATSLCSIPGHVPRLSKSIVCT
ncbi:hypothetical protein BJ970_004825 [Saccharopolyspora phatthalungensis]|uniref:Uncharacterized protein n=1 Tax=Saccharopolyspora phatthalungensis TaxID=664693 RepID=A0A840QBW1_9PSEU|nr:hypothetical protein [Saccharopolyspora phatthalungensis]